MLLHLQMTQQHFSQLLLLPISRTFSKTIKLRLSFLPLNIGNKCTKHVAKKIFAQS